MWGQFNAMNNFENFDKYVFEGKGKYDIPQIQLEHDLQIQRLIWIPWNYAKTAKEPETKGIHFYVDDYQFARLWNRPDDYINLLSRFGAVCAPDFSMYTDMPVAMQIYNHYRKHWLAAYWQSKGIHVVPTICWSTPNSFEWCFDGEPTDSVISISSVGSRYVKDAFKDGCREAIKQLNPVQILWYGDCPEEFDWNAVKIKPFYKEMEERRKWAEDREQASDVVL